MKQSSVLARTAFGVQFTLGVLWAGAGVAGMVEPVVGQAEGAYRLMRVESPSEDEQKLGQRVGRFMSSMMREMETQPAAPQAAQRSPEYPPKTREPAPSPRDAYPSYPREVSPPQPVYRNDWGGRYYDPWGARYSGFPELDDAYGGGRRGWDGYGSVPPYPRGGDSWGSGGRSWGGPRHTEGDWYPGWGGDGYDGYPRGWDNGGGGSYYGSGVDGDYYDGWSGRRPPYRRWGMGVDSWGAWFGPERHNNSYYGDRTEWGPGRSWGRSPFSGSWPWNW